MTTLETQPVLPKAKRRRRSWVVRILAILAIFGPGLSPPMPAMTPVGS